MRSVRNNLSWFLAVALMMQLVGIVAPMVLSAAGVDVDDVCTCPDATHGATCPMHHGKTGSSQNTTNKCTLKNASGPSSLGILTFSTGIGIVPPVNVFRVTVQSSVIDPAAGLIFSSRTELPDSPPPRA